MGLSGPRKRAKFSHDPNNTNWSRSESKYGQRILQAQGWRPGDYLGAKNAPHAKYHTLANSSHVKVALREDNLGIGARIGAAGGQWETTGLDSFQDLLGRLNGKSQEEIQQVQKGREVLKRNRYVEQRWGTLRFVSGGLLVGDRDEESKEDRELKDVPLERTDAATKVSSQLLPVQDDRPVDEPDIKRKKKLKKSNKGEDGDRVQKEETTGAASPASVSELSKEAQRRLEKSERKLQRKEKREARHQKRAEVLAEHLATTSAGEALHVEHDDALEIAAPSTLRSGIQTVRQRHIRQKRMAMMDSKALKEILMIKT